jgi:L-asparaginase II
MAQGPTFQPVLEVRRGPLLDSIHLAAIAVATVNDYLAYSYGDVEVQSFLGAAANPLKIIPFVEQGGMETFGLNDRELAVLCSSHDGSDEQVEILKGIQQKAGLQESDLLCGIQPPRHLHAEKALASRNEPITPNRHPCSGEHTALLLMALLMRAPKENYLDLNHPVQQLILKTIKEMGSIRPDEIVTGVDDCSSPTFGISLYKAATCFARLIDPRGLYTKRSEACARISKAMRDNPVQLSGTGGFEAGLMHVTNGLLFVKSGEHGYLGMGILPGAIAKNSPAFGFAIKIIDGDPHCWAREGSTVEEGLVTPIVTAETLMQVGALNQNQISALEVFIRQARLNCRNVEVGTMKPVFKLKKLI